MAARTSNHLFPRSQNGKNGSDRGYARLVKARRPSADAVEGRIVELAEAGKLAWGAQLAVSTQRRHGLPITTVRGDQVVRVFPDGQIEVLETLSRPNYQLPKGVRVLKQK